MKSLVRVLDKAVIEPANERLLVLRKRKAEELVLRHAKDYLEITQPTWVKADRTIPTSSPQPLVYFRFVRRLPSGAF